MVNGHCRQLVVTWASTHWTLQATSTHGIWANGHKHCRQLLITRASTLWTLPATSTHGQLLITRASTRWTLQAASTHGLWTCGHKQEFWDDGSLLSTSSCSCLSHIAMACMSMPHVSNPRYRPCEVPPQGHGGRLGPTAPPVCLLIEMQGTCVDMLAELGGKLALRCEPLPALDQQCPHRLYVPLSFNNRP